MTDTVADWMALVHDLYPAAHAAGPPGASRQRARQRYHGATAPRAGAEGGKPSSVHPPSHDDSQRPLPYRL